MTITVTSLAARNGGEEILVTVRLSDGEHEELRRFALTTAQYAELKPQKGEITEAQFDALEEAAEIGSAIRKGSGILAFGANSKRTLVQKLRRRGFDEEHATAAAEYLAEHKCLDESSDARREAELCLKKLWGRRRILEHLCARGYGRRALADVAELLDGVDFGEQCRRLTEKRFPGKPDTPKERQKRFAALTRYGYTPDEIRASGALDGLDEDADIPDDFGD